MSSATAQTVKTLLTPDWLKKNANEKSYARGVKVFEDEWAVRVFESTPGQLRAEVVGTRFYVVTFQAKNGGLTASCTCPAFQDYDGGCKHIVGAGLHAIKMGFKKEKATIAGTIQKHIAALKETKLREVAFRALLNDEDFRNEFGDEDGALFAEEDRRARWRE